MCVTLRNAYPTSLLNRLGPLGFMQNVCEGMRPSMKVFDLNVSSPPVKGGTTMAEIIKLCWHSNPSKRPSFSYLTGLIDVHTPESIRKEVTVRRALVDNEEEEEEVGNGFLKGGESPIPFPPSS